MLGITRDEDPELALLALTFRVGEGLLATIPIRTTLELLWLATASGSQAPDSATMQTLGTYFLDTPNANRSSLPLAAYFFHTLCCAVESSPFCWLGSALSPRPSWWWAFLYSLQDLFPAQSLHSYGFQWPHLRCRLAFGYSSKAS